MTRELQQITAEPQQMIAPLYLLPVLAVAKGED
jgi:hypothetical protein